MAAQSPPASAAGQPEATAVVTTPAVPDKSGYTLFNPTPEADLRSFDTDRPTKSNVPYTVDAGHFQYETDIAVFGAGNTDGVKTQEWTVLDPTLKLGLTNAIDAELQITPYESVSAQSAANRTRLAGIGDSFARLKINVLGDDAGAIALTVLPYVRLPTAHAELGSGGVEGGLLLPVSFNAPHSLTVLVVPEWDYLRAAIGSGYYGAFDFLINISHPLDRRWTLYAELFTTQSPEAQAKPIYTFDGALTYALTANTQLDAGANVGLNGVAPGVQLYTGLSQRF